MNCEIDFKLRKETKKTIIHLRHYQRLMFILVHILFLVGSNMVVSLLYVTLDNTKDYFFQKIVYNTHKFLAIVFIWLPPKEKFRKVTHPISISLVLFYCSLLPHSLGRRNCSFTRICSFCQWEMVGISFCLCNFNLMCNIYIDFHICR